jgi:hypothetical protein
MPDEPVPLLGEKEYEVVGPHAVHGAKTGEKVTLNLSAEQESFYVEGGHLKVVAAKGGTTKKEEEGS